MYDWSEVIRRERYVNGVRWQFGKGGRTMKWCGGRGGNIIKGWQFGKGERVVNREGGMEYTDKIALY